MIAAGKSANTVSNYVSGVNTVSRHYGRDVFAILDLAELARLCTQYGSGGEYAEIGASNSNNVHSGLRQWFVYQTERQAVVSEAVLDRVCVERPGDAVVREQVRHVAESICKRYPSADVYPLRRKNAKDIYLGFGNKEPGTRAKGIAVVLLVRANGIRCGLQHNGALHKQLKQMGQESSGLARFNGVETASVEQVQDWLRQLDAVLGSVFSRALNDGNARRVEDYMSAEIEQADDQEAPTGEESLVKSEDRSMNTVPLNQILFGPPGTGKTYNTINEALKILAPQLWEQNSGDDPDSRKRLKEAFDELVDKERIRFVTFHQSFSYEDFVEGLRARTDETTGQLRYDVVDGVFKSLCEAAASKVTRHAEAPSEVGQRRVWKMSLGNTLGDDASIFQECINGGYALLGYGGGINFAGCTNRQQVQERFAEEGVVPGNPGTDYGITSVTAFVAKMKVGDLIVVSDGNFKFRAIGEVTGDYQFKPHSEFDADYSQMRPVRWLRHYQPSLPHSELLNAQFSQMTLYELRAPTLNQEKLERLLGASASERSAENDARVLIIDEINRGSVSRIFGELITLIEESKRAGRPEALPIVLPYSQTRFTVPDNLYIIGTMNTTDRSLAGLDIALRRRFVFKEMPPRPELLDDVTVAGVNVGQLLRVMNQRIEVLLDRDHCLGHAYFMPLADDSTIDRLANIFRNQILPLLQEYFFEDWQRIGWVLNDHRKAVSDRFVQQKSGQAIALFGPHVGEGLADGVWALNEDAFERQEAYLGIIDASRLAVEPEVKRQASHGDLVLRELASGTIELLHNGKLKQPVLPVLRELASDAGIDIQNANGNDLNTRTLGGKLITHLSNGG
ncbi:restriction endonuclease [Halopseudomonas oceani]|uniref:Restriction endonuclease n=2 Tax=Halopseudomonas oceani TaxID=1708783 RepID=A0A2P4EQT5_9GAMM|nr:restriction endonuclease [Halopseudomonas oceani]